MNRVFKIHFSSLKSLYHIT